MSDKKTKFVADCTFTARHPTSEEDFEVFKRTINRYLRDNFILGMSNTVVVKIGYGGTDDKKE